MKGPKRYWLSAANGLEFELEEDPEGEWVKFDDYIENLNALLESLAFYADHETWKRPLHDFGAMSDADMDQGRVARMALYAATDQVPATANAKDEPDRSDKADARRFRWLLNGNGNFMEEESLCGSLDDNPAIAHDQMDHARRVIDEQMATIPATPDRALPSPTE